MEELSMYVGKRIKIKADNEEEFIGKAIGFTQALDNEPEIDEIDIRNESNNRLYGILKTEIKSIEVLE